MKTRVIHLTALALTVIMILASCESRNVSVRDQTRRSEEQFRIIAVMPAIPADEKFRLSRFPNSGLDCTMAQLCTPEALHESRAAADLTRLLNKELSGVEPGRLTPMTRNLAAFHELTRGDENDTTRDLARRFGKAVDADHVFIPVLWRYREKETYSGASVAFSVYLLSVADGRALWMASFDKTQHSLTDEILGTPDTVRRGARWWSVGELMQFGVEDVVSRLPDLS